MARRKREGTVSIRIVEASREVIGMGDGWTTNVWAVAEIKDTSGTYPPMLVRAEMLRSGRRSRAALSVISMGMEGRATLPRQISALGRLAPSLPAEILSLVTFSEPGVESSPEGFVRAMNQAIRTPNLTQFEREDQVLERWESTYEPKGFTQREAAEEMGLTHSTFRTYLAHARARRR